jgi:hypothetical protein
MSRSIPSLLPQDIYSLGEEGERVFNVTKGAFMDNATYNQLVSDENTFLSDVALTLGDVLLFKHLVTKHLALKTDDLNVSMFLETHDHIRGGG